MRQKMLQIREVKIETVLLILAIALSFGLRLYNLGRAPLSDEEAQWALQALQLADNQVPKSQIQLGPNVAYVTLTSILFKFFGSSNFLARFWPAFAGALLVFIPILFSRQKGSSGLFGQLIQPEIVVILVLALAIDPGLVTASRSAAGPMMSLAFILLAIGFWQIGWSIPAGIFTGLAFLSGPALIVGGLGLLFAWLLYKYLIQPTRRASFAAQDVESAQPKQPVENQDPLLEKDRGHEKLKPFLIAFGVAILVFGSMILSLPQGLSAWVNSIPTFIAGWLNPSGIPASRLIGAFLVYELFAISFALIWILRVITGRSPLDERELVSTIILVLWALLGLFIQLFYPGRQVSLLVWIIIPVWILAAKELSQHLPARGNRTIAIALGLFLLLLAGLLWYSIAATTRVTFGTSIVNAPYAILVGIVALAGLTVALVALGWQWETSQQGLVLGVSAALLLYSTSVMWGTSQIRHNRAEELWSSTPAPGEVQLMTKVLEEVSRWNTGFPQFIDLVSISDTPSLRWALREFPQASFVASLDKDTLPALVITAEDQQLPTLAASYRGEDFVWWENPAWSGIFPDDFARWFAFREAPLEQSKIILWSRSDLYPGEELGSEIE